ncbi:ralA-binding protein 1 isoform X2 [Bradysia coprophila]|uniref:ralA-binding protein 1 isoform X2 n=1 Tax=Bradysia coprophila TaxID=38358 RepID=UPI00187DB874|nr:ralA-binding protein 1 isoform X2 [Bradysia coprophila]
MDFDSPDPDVEKEFPGLYGSDSGGSRKRDDEDFSEGDHEKISKKEILLGRRKEKKDKKDKGYAALDGESSQEEDLDTNPSKSIKKSKAFKFPSKSKEKREKSREKVEVKEKDCSDVKDKKKDKEKKEKKEKSKEKEKKDKKSKQSSVNEEILELGDAQPIFGVSIGLSVQRNRCHDDVPLPLVVRDCIDYLQEHGLSSDQIYKGDAIKTRVQHLKALYNNRETSSIDDFDVVTACSLLKLFFKELPEPILTTDLTSRFEEAASLPVGQQDRELNNLINQLPTANRTLLSWMVMHLDAVTQHEKANKMSVQNVAILLGPTMQMTPRLLSAILSHCKRLFGDTVLDKYVPPITSTSPIPETPDEINAELRKQDSLLNQIHAEMNAGFVTKKREEQLWEVQRIITQLKRKLRTFEKKNDPVHKSLDDTTDGEIQLEMQKPKSVCSDDESVKTITVLPTESNETKTTVQVTTNKSNTMERPVKRLQSSESHPNSDQMYVNESGLLMLPENHPEFETLVRLQLENLELAKWKAQLQSRLIGERNEMVLLQEMLKKCNLAVEPNLKEDAVNELISSSDDEVVVYLLKKNSLLEKKKNLLGREIYDQHVELIQLQVELAVRTLKV